METRSVKRRKTKKGEEANGFCVEEITKVDRISDLPDSILHQILLLLPLRTAAKTSLVSKRWRSLFLSLPDLDFTSINNFGKPESFTSDSIYQVLSLRHHRDSNNLRSLRFQAPITFKNLNSLLRLAVTQQVQNLDIEVATKDYFNFPRWIITSQDLRALKLRSIYPGFRLPPSSSILGGFQKLTSLSLCRLILHNPPCLSDFFTDPSFPLLKKLNLESCFGLKELKQWNKDLWNMSNSEIQYWESQTYKLESFLNHLEFVEIHGFLECENDMSLAIFFLRHGKALIKMILRSSFLCRDSLRRQMIRSQLMGFSKASSKAKISFH